MRLPVALSTDNAGSLAQPETLRCKLPARERLIGRQRAILPRLEASAVESAALIKNGRDIST